MKMGLDITTCYVHTVGHAKHKGIYIGHTHDVMNVSLRFNPARVSVLRSNVIVGLVLYIFSFALPYSHADARRIIKLLYTYTPISCLHLLGETGVWWLQQMKMKSDIITKPETRAASAIAPAAGFCITSLYILYIFDAHMIMFTSLRTII